MKDPVKATAGALGGKARIYFHGNPGSLEGRRLGGRNSIATHKLRKTAFKTLREIQKPAYSAQLAELLGVLAGDGHVGTYQVSVVTNATTDIEHASFVQALLKKIFKLPVSLLPLKNTNAVIVLVSSKSVCDYLRVIGMPSGNKTRDQLAPPNWIFKSSKFKKAYVRGLIDTDGCVYLDRHTIKGKQYSSLCIAFTNASIPLLDFIEKTFKEIGYHPTRWGRHIRLRRKEEVLHYAKTIGFNNPKHSNKIKV